jgi:hypothetical protein
MFLGMRLHCIVGRRSAGLVLRFPCGVTNTSTLQSVAVLPIGTPTSLVNAVQHHARALHRLLVRSSRFRWQAHLHLMQRAEEHYSLRCLDLALSMSESASGHVRTQRAQRLGCATPLVRWTCQQCCLISGCCSVYGLQAWAKCRGERFRVAARASQSAVPAGRVGAVRAGRVRQEGTGGCAPAR